MCLAAGFAGPAANLDGEMRRESQAAQPAQTPAQPACAPAVTPAALLSPPGRDGGAASRWWRGLQQDHAAAGGMRLRWALVTGLVGGLVLPAAFPPYGFWPLAAVRPTLLVLALRGRRLRAAFAVGAVFGLAFFFPLLSWVINLAWYAWVALAVSESVIFAVLAVGQRLLLR